MAPLASPSAPPDFCQAKSVQSPDRQRLAIIADAMILVLVALVVRISTFGDPNVGGDEGFYQTVGIAMNAGAVPYVDIWDRKPWGLFFLYSLITSIESDPIGYQVAALIFAAATAFVISRIVLLWTDRQGAVLAGAAYLLFLVKFQGYGGQAPVFYNLFVVCAGALVLVAQDDIRCGKAPLSSFAAMFLAGLAITCKQTAFAEAAFLGLTCAVTLVRAPVSEGLPANARWLTIALWALLGCLPFAAISAGYWLAGHGDIYWQAMVGANEAKPAVLAASLIRLVIMFASLAPLLVLGTLAVPSTPPDRVRFVWLWLLAAIVGITPARQFYLHYGLSLLPPACLAASAFLSRRIFGLTALPLLAWYALADGHAWDFDHARRSKAAFARMAETIKAHKNDGPLFVFEGPSLLYPLTGSRPPTPLVFTAHLTQLTERNVSHLDTLAEVRRILALDPTVIVLGPSPKQFPPNMETERLVRDHVAQRCELIGRFARVEYWSDDEIDIWANCRRD
jgi:hypothetical protein